MIYISLQKEEGRQINCIYAWETERRRDSTLYYFAAKKQVCIKKNYLIWKTEQNKMGVTEEKVAGKTTASEAIGVTE